MRLEDYQRGNNIDISNNLNHLLPQSGGRQDNDIQRHEPSHHHHNYIKEGYQGDAPFTGDSVRISNTDEEIVIEPVEEDAKPKPTAPSV